MTAPNAPQPFATPHPTAPTGPGAQLAASAGGAPSVSPSNANGLAAPTPDASAKGESPGDAARLLARVRRLMLISSALTLGAIFVVLSLVGYRLLRSSEYHQTDLAVTLPRNAKILQTAVTEDLLVVTLDVGGAIEIRTYELHTLKPTGRLSFGFAP